ncbi:MAG: zinc ribbon domain-containing protein, partial [Armatimonadetes bacterium]|nr:zinc ribbon domain-containing protein [Armatimonadota bacterium]
MTIACPECGAENPPEGSACAACNSGLEVPCARCGFANRVGDRYCGGCGIRLDQAQAQTPAATTLSAQATPKRDELRTITVMMADLDGFAEMTEVYGRERQTEVMNTVIERLAEQHSVRTFDGYIDKVLDGDIMALFGAPIAHEDAP